MEKEITKEDIWEEFSKGINCSQFVVRHFVDRLSLDKKTATRLATAFEWGMYDGDTCGAVSGAYMVLGLKYGSDGEISDDEKSREDFEKNRNLLKEKISEFNEKFREKNSGHLECRNLLRNKYPEELDTIFEKNSLQTTCPQVVYNSIKILEEII